MIQGKYISFKIKSFYGFNLHYIYLHVYSVRQTSLSFVRHPNIIFPKILKTLEAIQEVMLPTHSNLFCNCFIIHSQRKSKRVFFLRVYEIGINGQNTFLLVLYQYLCHSTFNCLFVITIAISNHIIKKAIGPISLTT